MHALGGKLVISMVGGYFHHFIHGIVFFLNRDPSGVALEVNFIGDIIQHVQDQMRLNRYRIPMNTHAFSNQEQEDQILDMKQTEVQV